MSELEIFRSKFWKERYEISYVPEVDRWETEEVLTTWLNKVFELYQVMNSKLNTQTESVLYITFPAKKDLASLSRADGTVIQLVSCNDQDHHICTVFNANDIEIYVKTILASEAYLSECYWSIYLMERPLFLLQTQVDKFHNILLKNNALPYHLIQMTLTGTNHVVGEETLSLSLSLAGAKFSIDNFYQITQFLVEIKENVKRLINYSIISMVGKKNIVNLQIFENYEIIFWCTFIEAEILPEDFPQIPHMISIPHQGTIIFVVDEPFNSDNKKHVKKLTQFQMDLYKNGLLASNHTITQYVSREQWRDKLSKK